MSKRCDIPDVYFEGRAERVRGAGKLACPYSHISVKGSWWLGGWNDADMEGLNGCAEPGAAEAAPITSALAA
jgi:ribosome modulation factor